MDVSVISLSTSQQKKGYIKMIESF